MLNNHHRYKWQTLTYQNYRTEQVLYFEQNSFSTFSHSNSISEEGQFLALDLGGTNFRAILLNLHKGNIIREEVKRYHISNELRTGSGQQLFDYLAECLVDFVLEQKLEDVPLPLGFTFSFPMAHHSLDSACLVTWTKTFDCPDVVDRDVVKLLQQSLEKYGHNHIEVIALLNDTTGTLVSGM